MRGHFSIEWMAQSSQPAGTETVSSSGPADCGTHSESLPGFYCRQKSENVAEHEETRNLSTLQHNDQGTFTTVVNQRTLLHILFHFILHYISWGNIALLTLLYESEDYSYFTNDLIYKPYHQHKTCNVRTFECLLMYSICQQF